MPELIKHPCERCSQSNVLRLVSYGGGSITQAYKIRIVESYLGYVGVFLFSSARITNALSYHDVKIF